MASSLLRGAPDEAPQAGPSGIPSASRLARPPGSAWHGFEALAALADKESGDPHLLGWDLGRMRRLLAALGHPESAFSTILVTGSKGKGSTAAMLAAILRADGRRAGLYTQPHLHAYGERIVLDGRRIGAASARRGLRAVLSAAPEPVTAFEAATALACLYFARAGAAYGVFESGFGGPLDATVALDAAVVLVAAIEREHAGLLGADAAAIAEGEAHVARLARLAFSARQTPSVGARLSLPAVPPLAPEVPLGLRGWFQRENAALAAAAARALGVPEEAVRRGLVRVRWPGRLEVISRRPLVVADAAHTPLSAAALARALREEFPRRSLRLVAGTAADKDLGGLAAALRPGAARVWAVPIPGPRSMAPQRVAAAFAPATVAPSLREALAEAVAGAGPADLVCVTGSLTLVAAARACFRRR